MPRHRRAFLLSFLVVCLMSACAGSDSAAESTTAPPTESPVTAAPTTVSETTTSGAEATTTTTTTTTEGPKTFESGTFQVAFSILQPEGTVLKRGGTDSSVYELVHRSNPAVIVLFVAGGPPSPAAWVSAVADHMTVSEEVETTIGGLPATYVEYTSEKRGAIPGVLVWQNEKGDVGRVYFVDVDGVAVQIVAAFTADLWEGFLPEFEALVAGITWG